MKTLPHMKRHPLGQIDPNAARQAELYTDSRRRRSRGERRESLGSPQLDKEVAGARDRVAARRTTVDIHE